MGGGACNLLKIGLIEPESAESAERRLAGLPKSLLVL
jgi:hypothetical protein